MANQFISSLNLQAPKTGGTTSPNIAQPVVPNIQSIPQFGGNVTTTKTVPSSLSLGGSAKSPQDNLSTPSNTISSSMMKAPTTPDYSNYAAYMASQGFSNNTNPNYDVNRNNVPSVTPSPPTSQIQTQTGTPPQTQTGTPPPSPNASPYTATAPTYPGLIGTLAYQGSQNAGTSGQAYQDYQNAVANLNQLKQQYASAQGGIESQPIPLEFQQGRGQVLSRQYASQLDAAQQAVNQAQAAIGYQVQGQGLQQQAIGQAAGLAAPQPYGITNVPFNPATGQFGGIAGAQGQGIGGAGQVLGQLGASQQFYQQTNPAYSQAQSVYQGLNSFIQQNPDINPSRLNQANFWNAWLRGEQMSDPKFQQFSQYLNELLQTLTPIIGSQGVSDYKSQLVQSLVNPSASTGSIQQQLQNLMGIASDKMQATYGSFTNPQPYNPGQGSGATGNTALPPPGQFFGR